MSLSTLSLGTAAQLGSSSLSASGRSSWDTATAAQFHGPHTTTRSEGWVGCPGPGEWEGLLLPPVASVTHSSPTLSRRAPQHGRINAENEPSPRHGTHGPRPTGNPVCPSIPLTICVPPRLLSSFHSLSVFPRRSACRGESRGRDRVPSYSLRRARSSPLSRQS